MMQLVQMGAVRWCGSIDGGELVVMVLMQLVTTKTAAGWGVPIGLCCHTLNRLPIPAAEC